MNAGKKPSPEFSRVEGLVFCLAVIGVQLAVQSIAQWGRSFYSPAEGIGRSPYVSATVVGLIFTIGFLWAALNHPLLGMWSDRTRTQPGLFRVLPIAGRRRPFIFWGGLGMLFTSILFWYPPVGTISFGNFLYGTVVLCLHWTFFSMAAISLLSLAPEIARSEAARVRLGVWIAVGAMAGLAAAMVLPEMLIVRLDPARSVDQLVLTFPKETTRAQARQQLDTVFPGEASLAIVTAPNGMLTAILQGAAYVSAFATSRDEAVAFALPEDLGGQYAIEPEKTRLNLQFSEGLLDQAALDRIDTAVVSVLRPAFEQQAKMVIEGGQEWLVLTTPLVERMDKQIMHSGMMALMGLPGNVLRTEVDGGSVRIRRTDGKQLDKDLHDAFLAVAGRLAVQAHLIPMERQGARWLSMSPALVRELTHGLFCARANTGTGDGDMRLTLQPAGFSRAGYRWVAVLFAFITLFLLQLPVWLLRERDNSRQPSETKSGWNGGVWNYPFVVFCPACFLSVVGFAAPWRGLPLWVELGLDGGESAVKWLMLPLFLTCLGFLALIPFLTRWLHTKWMAALAFFIVTTGMPLMWVIPRLEMTINAKYLLGASICGYCGMGLSIMLVMSIPMLGEIIDREERRSGMRREGLYTGIAAMVLMAGYCFAMLVVTQLTHWFGKSLDHPGGVYLIGLVAGGCGLAGAITMLFYPPMHKIQAHETAPLAGKD